MNVDELGDRCKAMEMAEAGRKAMKGIPLLARLDGRAFHTYTRGLKRPYDEGMSKTMQETTKALVEDMHAAVGYTQSDEITLAWFVAADTLSRYPFDGRFQKLTSVLAGLASTQFTLIAQQLLPEKNGLLPHFDCRVWQVPSFAEAVEVFMWREADAVKNSITMAASAYYSHKELHGVGSKDKHQMLFEKGVNWNHYPAFFKRGVYFQRRVFERPLTTQEIESIPGPHRPAPGTLFKRSKVVDIELPPISKVKNIKDVLFLGEAPTTETQEAA